MQECVVGYGQRGIPHRAMKVIAITGGIGSGKSTVSRMLRAMGYSVYDCDSRARQLMDNSDEIKGEIRRLIGVEAVSDAGVIDRRFIARRVFADAALLSGLNAIVHPRVRCDLHEWKEKRCDEEVVFVETAILEESGLKEEMDDVWRVWAPEELRVRRVMSRSGLTETEVRARISAQTAFSEYLSGDILNDEMTALTPQIVLRLAKCR